MEDSDGGRGLVRGREIVLEKYFRDNCVTQQIVQVDFNYYCSFIQVIAMIES